MPKRLFVIRAELQVPPSPHPYNLSSLLPPLQYSRRHWLCTASRHSATGISRSIKGRTARVPAAFNIPATIASFRTHTQIVTRPAPSSLSAVASSQSVSDIVTLVRQWPGGSIDSRSMSTRRRGHTEIREHGPASHEFKPATVGLKNVMYIVAHPHTKRSAWTHLQPRRSSNICLPSTGFAL